MNGYEFLAEYIVCFIHLSIEKNDLGRSFQDFFDVLVNFKCKDTIKRCVPAMVVNASQFMNNALQERIYRNSIDIIGDPADDTKWSHLKNSTQHERETLIKARDILNIWLTNQFISVFFQNISNYINQERKDFWRKYIPYITQLKIYGKSNHKQTLLNDPRIQKYVQYRFGNLIYGGNSECALCFIIKNRLFVEFGAHGNALYVFKTDNQFCPNISEPSHRVNSLKSEVFRNDRTYLRLERDHDEGRLFHNDGWQRVLSRWMKNKLGV